MSPPINLTATPDAATWLNEEEKHALRRAAPASAAERTRLGEALTDSRLWLFGFIYFCLVLALYGFGFFAPQILRSLGNLSTEGTGWVTAAPYLVASLAMPLWARHSDRRRERHWHFVIPTLAAAVCFLVAAQASSLALALPAFALAAAGVYAACPIFWTLPTRMLSGVAAAGGIALINSIGNLAGYFGPFMMGYLKDATGSYSAGISLLSAGMAVAGLSALLLRKGAR
jgi:ACS family tartrate transporter-like MFS transporter